MQDEGILSIGPSLEDTSPTLTQINFESTVQISGALLSSPTAYNLFTAYSIISKTLSDAICVTSTGPRIILPTAFSEVLTSASGHVQLDQSGEQRFLNYLSFSTCSLGSDTVVPTALIRILNVTATTTTTHSNVILVAATQSLTVAPVISYSSHNTPGFN